jgi:hypothetical protein
VDEESCGYCGAPPLGWSAGPHFFFTLRLVAADRARRVHAVSFNAVSWGVECVGDFGREKFDGAVRDKYGVRRLHFRRDDPKTTKTCPGKGVDKAALIKLVQVEILAMTGGDHLAEQVKPVAVKKVRTGIVNTDGLNVRLRL